MYDFKTKITKNLILKARWISEEPVTDDFELDIVTMSLNVGSSRKVIVTLPEKMKNTKLLYASNDKSIATVRKHDGL